MRRPSDIPGLDPDMLKRHPADSLRALGERLGLDDARAGARVSPTYLRHAVGRMSAFSSFHPAFTPDELHELSVGLVVGMDDFLKLKGAR